MKSLGYYNGKIGPVEELTVPFTDRGLYFGDGVYDATCAANHIPFALDRPHRPVFQQLPGGAHPLCHEQARAARLAAGPVRPGG